MLQGFVLPIIGFFVVAVFEAIEPGLEHRNTIFGLRELVISHPNRLVESALRAGWTTCVRFGSTPIMLPLVVLALFGFGSSSYYDAMKADEKVTLAYWEAQGTNWTSSVSAAVAAGHAPDWNDPAYFETRNGGD